MSKTYNGNLVYIVVEGEQVTVFSRLRDEQYNTTVKQVLENDTVSNDSGTAWFQFSDELKKWLQS